METRRSRGIVFLAGIFAVLAVSVALATFYFENNKNGQGPSVAVGGTDTKSAKVLEAEADDDQDGLLNWEEVLWKTDPYSADTDRDGVSDKDEIAMRASPTVFGTSTVGIYQSPAGLMPTEALARDFLTEYVTLYQDEENPPTEEEKNLAVKALVERNAPAVTVEVAPVTLADLKIDANASVEAYAYVVTEIMRESLEVKEYELETFARAVTARDPSKTTALTPVAAHYANIKKNLAAMPIPENVAEKHLAVVNSVGALAAIVGKMGAWSGDSLTALALMNTFYDVEQKTETSVNDLYALLGRLIKKT